MNWEIGIDMYTLMCIKWMTNKKKFKLFTQKWVNFIAYKLYLKAVKKVSFGVMKVL